MRSPLSKSKAGLFVKQMQRLATQAYEAPLAHFPHSGIRVSNYGMLSGNFNADDIFFADRPNTNHFAKTPPRFI